MTSVSVNLWTGPAPLILASQSASRKMLFANAGFVFETQPADLDERALQDNSGLRDPGAIAALLARAKAAHVAARNPGKYIVGADQTLALGERLFSKPSGRAQAADQIRLLSGGTHQLHSAIAVARDGETLFETVSVARMSMRTLSDAAIENYLDHAGDAVTRSVGAYQLEGLGVHLFERIEGDHFTILGLPLVPLLDFFRRAGLLAL